MDSTKRIECSLQERIAFLRSLEDESSIIKLKDDHSLTMKVVIDALQLARFPRNIHRFLKCCGLVEDIIEMYIVQGKEARRLLIYSLVEIFIDMVICGETSVCSKMELSRIFNVVLEGCSLKVAHELLKRDNFISKIEKLFSEISSAGDFELQVMLIESMLRLIPQKASRESFFHELISDQRLLSNFLDVRDSHFDVDCRTFLNRFNEKNNSSSNRVYSFPVENVKLDGEQIYKPNDEGYDDFWIDFNTGSKRISLFCQSTLLPSQLSQNKESRWETLSLRASDTYRYTCEVKNKFWVVTVELKVNAQMLTNKDPEKQPHLFMCQLSQCYDVQTALNATMKLESQKVSVPQDLFFPLRKDPPVAYEHVDARPKKHIHDLKSAPRSHPDVPNSSQDNASLKKCSIPLEPYIITSSISSTDGSRLISWQAIHKRINSEKSKPQCRQSTSGNLCDKSIGKCSTSSLKSTTKSSALKTPTEIRSTTKVTKELDPSGMNRGMNYSEEILNNRNKSHKENAAHEKPSAVIPSSNIYQSPVTASGDHVCPVNKPGMPIAAEKRVTKNVQKESNIVVSECQISSKEKKSSRTKASVNKSLEKTPEHDEEISTKHIKNITMTHSSSHETNPSSRKSSLRSGKKVLTPVVCFKPIASKSLQNRNLEKETSPGQSPANSFENNLIQTKNVKKKNVGVVDGDTDSSNRKPSHKTSECRTPNNVLKSNEYKTASGSFDDFKAPKVFNVSKAQGRIKKKKKEIQNSVLDRNQSPKDILTKSVVDFNINPEIECVAIQDKVDTVHDFHGDKLHNQENKKLSPDSDQQTKHGRSRKNKKEIQTSFLDPNQGPKDLLTKSVVNSNIDPIIDSVAIQDKTYTVHAFHREKVPNQGYKKFSADSNQQTKQQNESLRRDKDSIDCNEKDCDTVTESVSSFELYVENDKSEDRDAEKCFDQDFVSETQINKTPDVDEDWENRDNVELLTTNWLADKHCNDGKTHGATLEDLTFSKQFNISNDTQTSNAGIGSFVFKKNNDTFENADGINKGGISKEDRITTFKSKKNVKDKENGAHKSNDFVKSKNDAPFTKDENSKKEQVREIINKKDLQENCERPVKSKSTRNKNGNCFITQAISEQKSKAPESSPTVTSSNDILEKPHGDSGDNISKHDQSLHCGKNLRARNKDICYAECDSLNGSNVKHNLKDMSTCQKKSAKRNIESKIDRISFLSTNLMDTSSSSKHFDFEPCDYANQRPSMKNEDRPHQYRIWKSQEFKTTLTTVPITGSAENSSPDPYDFNSECMPRVHNVEKHVPFKSNSLEVYNNQTSATFNPSQKDKHRKSKKSTESIHFQQNITTRVEFKEHIWKSQKVKNKERRPETCLKDDTPGMGKPRKRFYNHSEPLNGAERFTSSSFGIKGVKKNDAPNYSGGGLYFPHLDDSIPCTPYSCHEDDNDIDTNYGGTELSWIAKVNTTPAKRKKMRGKTYGHNKTIYNEKQIHNEKTAPLSTNNTCHGYEEISAEECNGNGKHLDHRKKLDSNKSKMKFKKNLFNTFDSSNLAIPSPDSPSESRGSKRKKEKRKEEAQISSPMNPMNIVLESIFGKQKTPKQKLPFEVNSRKDKKNKLTPKSKTNTASPMGYSFDSPSNYWNKTEHTTDRTTGSRSDKKSMLFKGIESGPSSACRLSKSALKRKYPSVSSDSMQEHSSDLPPEINSPYVARFLPRKLFDSDVALEKVPRKAKQRKISSLKHSMKASGDNLSSGDESTHSSQSIKYNLSEQSRPRQQTKAQKKMKIKSTPTLLKTKFSSKSQKKPKELSNYNTEQSISSPEISRESVKVGKKFLATQKRTNLELGFLSGIQSLKSLITSPVASNSQQSFEVDSPLANDNHSPKSRSFHEITEGLHDMDSDAKEMECDDEEYGSPYKGLTDLIQLGKANSAAPSQVSSVSDPPEQILKSTNRIMKSSWTEGKGKRSKAIIEFDRCLQSVVRKADRFSKEMKEAELKTTLLLSQQIQKLKSHREFSEQSLESLKYACGDLMNEVQEAHTNQDRMKKSVKSALKKDFDALTFSVKTKFNEHSLEAMRRCLQASFMMS